MLSQLAVLLMPDTPVEELFRSFPAPEGWSGHSLAPDLAVYGVLKDKNAGLFVEYDGDWRHGKKEGLARDQKKNAALLAYAPAGSFVVRISHTRKTRLRKNILWVNVESWSRGDDWSLLNCLQNVVQQVFSQIGSKFCPNSERVLRTWLQNRSVTLSEKGNSFANVAAAEASGNTREEILEFLSAAGFRNKDIEHLQQRYALRGRNIEKGLKPTICWLNTIGLTSKKVVEVISRFPSALDYGIERNLIPKRQWLLDLGLSKSEVAKVILGHPPVLGYSIEQNLIPKRQWLLDLGLSKSEVAKVISGFPPVLGLSIEQNLIPKWQWLLDLGLSKSEVAKVILGHPPVLGYSIEQNLIPKRQWLLDLGLSKSEVAKVISGFPPVLGLSIEQNLIPKWQWLLDLGLSKSEVAKVILGHPHVFSYSIERNMIPKWQWLLDLGLSKSEVAKVILGHPHVFSYSIERNLAVKVALLRSFMPEQQVTEWVSRYSTIFSYSMKRLSERLGVLFATGRSDEFIRGLIVKDEDFRSRYMGR